MKRITLIALPAPFLIEPAMNPPLGLCSIGTMLKRAGYEITVIDFAIKQYDYNEKEYLNEIPKDSDLYLISCVSAQFKYFKESCLYIKQNTEAKIIAGGPHVSSEPLKCLKHVDIAFNGEVEDHILDLVGERKPLELIPGACYVKDGKKIRKARVFVKDLNKIPLPDLSIFEIEKYKRKIQGEKAFHIMTLRGCPYRCNFCDSDSIGGKLRLIDKNRLFNWIDKLIADYGIKSFVIYDDTFTTNSKRVIEFCEEFKKRGIKWRCWSRANTIREKDLEIMKDSGLESVSIGLESGSQKILDNINKTITVNQNRKAIQICKKVGIPIRCSLMFGNPGESIETLNETIKFIEETQPEEWNLFVLNPSPGSEFWNNPKKHGLKLDKRTIERDDYKALTRSGDTGMGEIIFEIETIPKEVIKIILKKFVARLEQVCPRIQIRDTVQALNTKEL